MHFQNSTRQWWSSLCAQGIAPKTWKALCVAIMKNFLASNAKDKVLTAWQSLRMLPNESVHKYIDRFWDLQLKATVFTRIHFSEQKQQFCAGLTKEMSEYVNSQKPKSIAAAIHNAILASQIYFQGGKKPSQGKDAHESKGKGTLSKLRG